MIIFNKQWLDNLQIIRQTEKDYRSGCFTADEFRLIRLEYPIGFYKPGIFGAIGLFVLSIFVISTASGFISLLLEQSHMLNTFVWPLVLGIIIYTVLELIMRDNHLYHSGIDNAAIYISGSLIAGGLIWLNGSNSGYLTNAVIIFVLATYLTIRFTDVLTASVTCLSFFAIVFFGWQKMGSFGLATMPFMMIIAAGAGYISTLKLSKYPNAIYYENCLLVIKITCLAIFYAAGNYLVVNRLNNQLNNLDDATHTTIPFGLIFWIWTFATPAAYLYFGIVKKQTLLLRLGMLLLAAAMFTFRTYYHLFSVEVMLSIGGALLLAVAFGVIRYLKTPRHGITDKEPEDKNHWDGLKLESLIIGETSVQTTHVPTDNGYHFGGGSSGGSGSSGNF